MKNVILSVLSVFVLWSCNNDSKKEKSTTEETVVVKDTLKVEVPVKEVKKTAKQIKEALVSKGFKVMDYIDPETQDTIVMQQYFMAFLKQGPIHTQNEEESARLQAAHLEHLSKMYAMGYADISGPFGSDGDIREVTIYNVPTKKMADSLANADPMVEAGQLKIEIHPWWAAKGFLLR